MIVKLSYFGSSRFRKCEIKQIGKNIWLKLGPRKHHKIPFL